MVVKPYAVASGRPWVWRARFWGHEPQTDLAMLERSARRHESAGIALDEPIDLWPDDTDLAGGRLEVFDARGNRIAQLSITSDDLERWLQASGVEPTEAESGDDG